MTVSEFCSKVHVDGKLIENVVQIQADALQTTIVWDVPRQDADPVRRILTVESEAVTIG